LDSVKGQRVGKKAKLLTFERADVSDKGADVHRCKQK
jgi:hypothetical protein